MFSIFRGVEFGIHAMALEREPMTEEALAKQMKAAFRAAAENVGQPPKGNRLRRLRQEVARGVKALRERVADTLELAAVKVAATKAHVLRRISSSSGFVALNTWRVTTKTRVAETIRCGRENVAATAERTRLAARQLADGTKSQAMALRKAACHRLRSGRFQATAAGAVTGAAALGASGGATGLASGAAIGTALGSLGALFTFGLSVPIGAAIGGGTGWAIGTTVGAGVGAMGGGAAASKLYARRQNAKQM